jgi:hypothetical protein
MNNQGINKNILMEYLKTHPPFNINKKLNGIENITVLEKHSIYFKVKLDNYISSLYNIDYKTYKIFERNFKLKKLSN